MGAAGRERSTADRAICTLGWLAWTVPAQNPVDGAEEASAPPPAAIGGVGHWWEESPIPPGDGGTVRWLDVETVEPLTVLASSWEGDVRLHIELPSGDPLAFDDDSYGPTDALVHWRPPGPGRYGLRVTSRAERAIPGHMAALRGTLDPRPRDPHEAARGFWHMAFVLAQAAGDDAWAHRAVREIVALEGLTDESAFFAAWEPRLALLHELAPLLEEIDWKSEAAWKELQRLDRAAWHRKAAQVADAVRRLLAVPNVRHDPVVGWTLFELGFVAGWLHDDATALVAWRFALDYGERVLPSWDPDLAWLRIEYAVKLADRGRYLEALEQNQLALPTLEALYPPHHELVLRARHNLALTRWDLGELELASVELERLAQRVESDPRVDGLDAALLWWNLLDLRTAQGRMDAARVAEERVRERLAARAAAPHDPDPAMFRVAVANRLARTGEVDAAIRELEAGLAELTPLIGPEHPHVQDVRTNLAQLWIERGEHERARREAARAVAHLAAAPGTDGADEADARAVLARALLALAETDDATRELQALADLELERLALARLLPWHLAREVVDDVREHLTSFVDSGDDVLARLGPLRFALVEAMRLVAARDHGRVHTMLERDPDVERLRRDLLEVVTTHAQQVLSADAKPEMADNVLARDAILAQLTALEERSGIRPITLRPTDVARGLGRDEGVLGWYRVDGPDGAELHAHVVRADGSLTAFPPLAADEVERLVQAYRDALGVRHTASASSREADRGAAEEAGHALRARVLDPILDAHPDLAELHVCPAGALQHVDLETLPGPDSELLGQSVRFRLRPSLRGLVAPSPPARGEDDALALLYDVDYEGRGAEPVESAAASAGRAASGSAFPRLEGTRQEAAFIRGVFAERFPEAEVRELLRAGATKAALFDAVGGARFVHLATHGFAGLDDLARLGLGPKGEDATRRVEALSPLALSGIALAGAARGGRADGRVPGILSAEELTAFDLSSCELLVLSACSTAAGIRRPGLGLQSLCAAAHAAGARRAIATLWPVDDERTSRMLRAVYARMWRDGLSPSDALWQEKLELWEQREARLFVGAWVTSSAD